MTARRKRRALVPLALPGLLAAVDDPQTTDDLRTYFAPPTGTTRGYTGRRFERLAGGGDRACSANVITADDLIAVQLLSVRVPARTALELLEGELGHNVTHQLEQIPTTVDLGSPPAAGLLAPGEAAQEAWWLLEAARGIGWVTAGKLLARKRPRLIPVYDHVAKCALGAPDHPW